MKVFSSDQQPEAVKYLRLEGELRVPIIAAIPRLQQALRARQ